MTNLSGTLSEFNVIPFRSVAAEHLLTSLGKLRVTRFGYMLGFVPHIRHSASLGVYDEGAWPQLELSFHVVMAGFFFLSDFKNQSSKAFFFTQLIRVVPIV